MSVAVEVSAPEFAVLDTLVRKRIAAVPEVAVVARLTPSEVKDTVAELRGKNLIELIDPNIIRITDRGEMAVQEARSRYAHRVLLNTDPDAVEAAFQTALKKLSG